MIRRVSGKVFKATKRGIQQVARRTPQRRSQNTFESNAEVLEERLVLHAAHSFDVFAGASALGSGARVVENFDDENFGHTLSNFPTGGAPAAVQSGGPTGDFLRLSSGPGSLNGLYFDNTTTIPFLIVSEFDFRMTPGGEGFGFGLADPTYVQGYQPDTPAQEPGLWFSLGVGFDIKQDEGEVSDNHVSLHWNGSKITEADAGSIDLDAGGDSFIRAKVISSPLRAAQGGEVSVILQELDNSGTPVGQPVTVIDREFIPTYVNYLGLDFETGFPAGLNPYFSANTGFSPTASVDLDNINVVFDPVADVPIEATVQEVTFTAVENDHLAGQRIPTADVIVQLNTPTDKRVAINYTVTQGTATAGQDYLDVSQGQILLPARQSWGVIKIPLLDDNIEEADENFSITIDSVDIEAPVAPPTAVTPAPAAVPTLTVTAGDDPVSGFNVFVDTTNFTFAPENAGGAHVPGEGHLELYIDGQFVSRMFTPDFHLPRVFPGPHIVTVVAKANDFSTYVSNGAPIQTNAQVLVARPDSYPSPRSLDPIEATNTPTLDITVTAVPGTTGFNVHADFTGYTVNPENASSPHVDGEGHLHIYVDGVRINRMYGSDYFIEGLTEGTHTVRVDMATNNHRNLTVGGQPIQDSFTFTSTGPFASSTAGGVGTNNTATVTIVDNDNLSEKGHWSGIIDLGEVAVHMAMLPTGEVLYFDRLETAKIFNPADGTVREAPSPALFNEFCAGHSFLPDGRLFITGGHGTDAFVNGPGVVDTAIYDPWTDTWEVGPDMDSARWYPTNTLLPNGEVLIQSGTENLFWKTADVPEVYNPDTGELRKLTGAEIEEWTYPFNFVGPDGRVFNAGPRPESYWIDPTGDGSIEAGPVQNFDPGDELRNISREYGAAAEFNQGEILIAGGQPPVANLLYDLTGSTAYPTGEYYPTRSAEFINLNDPVPSWTETQMAFGRRHGNATTLADGTVLITGGGQSPGFNDANSPVFAAELFDPETGTFEVLSAMDVPRLYHNVGVLLPDGRVAVAGGGQPVSLGDTVNHTEMQIFSPPYLYATDGSLAVRPTIDDAPEAISYGQTFLLDTTASVGKVSLVGLGATTHAFNHSQSYIELDFTSATGGIDITGPANSIEAVSGYYMLFIHDVNGVPSESVMIRVDVAGLDVRVPGGPAATTVDETGTTSDFTVALSAPPTSNVVINVDVSDATEASVSPATLTFTPANWNTPQTVTVTGVDDDIFDSTVKSHVMLSVDDAASDSSYALVTDFNVPVTTTNDESLNVAPGDTFISRLNPEFSDFGDEFVNFESVLGQRPHPGNTHLTGWMEVSFSEVTDTLANHLANDLGQPIPDGANVIQFNVDYAGAGTDEHIEWGTGAQYRLRRERVFKNPLVGDPSNAGVLDLNSGEVYYANVDALLSNTVAQKTNRINRFASGFPNSYPLPPADAQTQQILGVLQPQLEILTDREQILEYVEQRTLGIPTPTDRSYLFNIGNFHWTEAGDITNFEFHGETMTPSFVLGLLPPGDPPFGFPAPFALGSQGEFLFPNPTTFWRDPDPELLARIGPNSISPNSRLPFGVYLHPHIDILTETLQKVEGIDPLRPSTSLPEALGANLALESGGKLYTFGGIQADGQLNTDLYEYDNDANTWTLLSPASGTTPVVRYAAGASIGGNLYVAGGDTANGVSGGVWVYDTAANTWSTLSSMPKAVHSAAFFTDGTKLFVAGGMLQDGSLSDDLQIYDTASDSWTFGAKLPRRHVTVNSGGSQGRAGASGVFDGNIGYMLGGTTNANSLEASTDAFIYNPRLDNWFGIPAMTEGTVYAAASFLDNQIDILGGFRAIGGETSNTHQVLDAVGDEWVLGGDTRIAIGGGGFTVLNERLTVVGGFVKVGAELDVNDGPGQVLSSIMSKSPKTTFAFSTDKPLIHSLSLVNAADISNRVGPNSRAILFGYGFGAHDPQNHAVDVKIDGQSVDILFPLSLQSPTAAKLVPQRLYLQIPDSIRAAPGQEWMDLTVTVNGVSSSTRISPIRDNAPSLFIYDSFEADERAYLDDAFTFAHDADNNMVFPRQPARPGESIVFYATGLGLETTPADVTATIDGVPATVQAVSPDPLGQGGVMAVTIQIPAGTQFANNLMVRLTSDGVDSNRGQVAIFPEQVIPDRAPEDMYPAQPDPANLSAPNGRGWFAGMAPGAEFPGISVVQSDGSTTVGEDGSTDTFTVVLRAQPSANVVIDVSSSDTGEATVSGPLTFTPANWNQPQTVTVTGVADGIFDAFVQSTITVAVNAGASAPEFGFVSPNNFLVTTNNADPLFEAGDAYSGKLDPLLSATGDNLLNLPPVLGAVERPFVPLGGWVNLRFQEVTDETRQFLGFVGFQLPPENVLQFNLDYFANGNSTTLNFDSGAQYLLNRVHAFAAQSSPVSNQGYLNPLTGDVYFTYVDIGFRQTLASGLNRFNRSTYGAGQTYPLILPSAEAQQAFSFLTPQPETLFDPAAIFDYIERRDAGLTSADENKIFSIAQFEADANGDFSGFTYKGETTVPAFFFSSLPVANAPSGFPAPFGFGPNGEYYFSNPDSFWKEPTQELLDAIEPNGIITATLPAGVYFQPRIDFVTSSLSPLEARVSPASLPESIGGLSTVESGGNLFAFGGRDADGSDNTNLYRYNKQANAWSEIVPASGTTPAVSFAASGAHDGKIYVAGGWTSSGQTLGGLWVYDVATNAWSALTDLPTAVHSAAFGISDGKLIVAGGFAADGSLTNATQIYDIAAGTWGIGEPIPQRGNRPVTEGDVSGRAAAASAVADGTLYVLGGTASADGEGTTDVWVYNVAEDRWTEAPALLDPVVYGAGVAVDGQVQVHGGRTHVGGESVSVSQIRDLESDFGRRRLDSSELPIADSGAAVLDGRVYLVGGHMNFGVEAELDGPGRAVPTVRVSSPSTPWSVSDDQPVIQSVVEAANFTSNLGPNSRAAIFGHGLIASLDEISVTIEGVPVQVILPLDLNQEERGRLQLDRLYIHIPDDIPVTAGKGYFDVEVTVSGNTTTSKMPVIDDNSPMLFMYDFTEPHERTFLDDAPGFAVNDGMLNFAAQPARPGGQVTMYVTGLRSDVTAQDLTATIDNLSATVVSVGTDPLGQAGVTTVTLEVPAGVTTSNNVMVTLEASGNRSNRVAIAVYSEAEVGTPAEPQAASVGREWIIGLTAVANFTIVQTAGGTVVSEDGSTDTFTVALNQQPTSDVVINVTSGDVGEAAIAPASLTFTSTNWDTPQTITVTGVDDAEIDGDQLTTITLSVDAAASDDAFDSSPDGSVVVTTTDNDQEVPPVVVGSDNGTNVRIVDPETGETIRTIDLPGDFAGGARAAAGDVNGDGTVDVIAGSGPGSVSHIRVIDGATGDVLRDITPFPTGFTGGIFVASGDVNGDGTPDVIAGADAGGGPHIRVFDGTTGERIHSFFPFNSAFPGGVRVASGDVNGDGFDDIIAAAGPGGGPHVKVFDGQTLQVIHSFFPFHTGFGGGVYVGAGDVNGDGSADIITAAGPGGGPHVRVFDGTDLTRLGDFFAYDVNFTGGVRVAGADIDMDGRADVITTPASGNLPTKAFNGVTGVELDVDAADLGGGFFASSGSTGSLEPVGPELANAIPNRATTVGTEFNYTVPSNTFRDRNDDELTYSATLANGDALPAWLSFDPATRTFSGTPTTEGGLEIRVTADDNTTGTISDDFSLNVRAIDAVIPKIAVSASRGSQPNVGVFDASTGDELLEFLVFDPTGLNGVDVALADINGDSVDDVIVAQGSGGAPRIRVYDGETGTQLRSFFAYNPGFAGGVRVAAADVNGDGTPDIITGAGPGGGPHVKVFDGTNNDELYSFFAYNPAFTGGVEVSAGDVNGDGKADIITAPISIGGPNVKVFDGDTGSEIRDLNVFENGFTGGVLLTSGDVNNDGIDDIIAGSGPGRSAEVRVFDGVNGTQLATITPFSGSGGVSVGSVDANGDGIDDIVTGGFGGGDAVSTFDGQTFERISDFALDAAFQGGVLVD